MPVNSARSVIKWTFDPCQLLPVAENLYRRHIHVAIQIIGIEGGVQLGHPKIVNVQVIYTGPDRPQWEQKRCPSP